MPPSLQHRDVIANGIRIHRVEAGTGPLVLLCHGFPEGWYSWRLNLRRWPAPVIAWLRRTCAGTGTPNAPPILPRTPFSTSSATWSAWSPLSGSSRHSSSGTTGARRSHGTPRSFAPTSSRPWLRSAFLSARAALRRVCYSISGDAPAQTRELSLKPGAGWLANTLDPARLPGWLTDADLDHMASEFAHSGFRGGLNWYRNIDRNWELTAPWAGARIRQPALFIAGRADPIIAFGSGPAALKALSAAVPGLRGRVLIDGAGHFVQQERPRMVNEALLEFLAGLRA